MFSPWMSEVRVGDIGVAKVTGNSCSFVFPCRKVPQVIFKGLGNSQIGCDYEMVRNFAVDI